MHLALWLLAIGAGGLLLLVLVACVQIRRPQGVPACSTNAPRGSVASSFDGHADTYDDDLNRGLSVSGENKEYFAHERVRWLASCLARLGEHPQALLDYGCGIGDTTNVLQELLKVQSIVGVDVSVRSLERARAQHGSGSSSFLTFGEYQPSESLDLAYCNGVFHHISPAQRDAAIAYVYQSLRPGGFFALWENNPWNPGTRYVMSRIPFDRDAITIPPPEARILLKKSGFEIIRTDYQFFFPRMLKSLRFLESHLSGFPLGAQYQVLARKPNRTSRAV
jgi:SAM-dependent methyltransferase